MIDCPNCGISFTPSYATCPKCNNFETPRSARMAYLKDDAEDRLHDGDLPEDVLSDLITNGLSELDADQLVRNTMSSLKRKHRGFGIIRLMIGIVMICFGISCIGCLLLTLRPDAPVRLDAGATATILGGGIFFSFIGLLAFLSGILATLTGQE